MASWETSSSSIVTVAPSSVGADPLNAEVPNANGGSAWPSPRVRRLRESPQT